MTNETTSFVKEALSAKLPRPEIAAALKKAGWADDEIASAISAYADVDFPIPVPRRRPYLSARETFVYLLLFLCLYLSAWSFGSLLFDLINRAFPDALDYYASGNSEQLRLSISMLAVSFPIYIWLTTMTRRWITADPNKRDSKNRKWLTYLTLFVAAGIMIGDTITLLYNMLGGELTTRFCLKVFVILLIAGMIFGYYLWDLRQGEQEK